MGEKAGHTLDWHERFWSKVNRSSGCWEWAGRVDEDGYGRMKVGGIFYRAHRLSFEIANGPIAAGVHICHHCDNPRCVRPDHLYAGSPQTNRQDTVDRKRAYRWHGRRRGEKNPASKLTEKDVLEVHRLRTQGRSIQKIADQYRVSARAITDVLSGATWSHLHPTRAAHG